MAEVGSWVKKEFREIFPVFVFFFFSFTLLALTFSAVLDQYHVEVYEPFEYLVGSLIVAKAVVLVDTFLKTAWLRSRPLIYLTIFNTAMYSVAAIAVRYLEQVLSLLRRQHLALSQANQEVLAGMTQPRYWALVAWLIALVFIYCILRELIRCVGSARFRQLFFGIGCAGGTSGMPSASRRPNARKRTA